MHRRNSGISDHCPARHNGPASFDLRPPPPPSYETRLLKNNFRCGVSDDNCAETTIHSPAARGCVAPCCAWPPTTSLTLPHRFSSDSSNRSPFQYLSLHQTIFEAAAAACPCSLYSLSSSPRPLLRTSLHIIVSASVSAELQRIMMLVCESHILI